MKGQHKKYKNAVAALILAIIILLTASAHAVEEGKKAKNFTLQNIYGKKVKLSDAYKNKVVLLSFWASWCPSCREEVGILNMLYKKYKKAGLEIYGINYAESKKKVISSKNDLGIMYPVLMDKDGSVAEDYELVGIPAVILIDKKGIVRFFNVIPPDEKDIEKVLKKI